jgi:hypothetical protein
LAALKKITKVINLIISEVVRRLDHIACYS